MPSVSVIIPVYNRVALLPHPLASLRTAAAQVPGLDWEVIVVDDGSTEDVAAAIQPYRDLPIQLHRQSNSGLLGARLAGLRLARKDTVLFLDGDDLVAAGKFSAQLPPLESADLTYGDVGRVTLGSNEAVRTDPPVGPCTDPVEFYLGVQPAPHNPIFRRAYLQAAVASPLFPPARAYDSIAETWFYYQLSVRPAVIRYVPGAWSIVGEHAGERISRKWEVQAWGALQLMQAFAGSCPVTPETESARRRVAQCAFSTWRALPKAFTGFPVDAFLAVWNQLPHPPATKLGGGRFQQLARIVGPIAAARILRQWQRPAYRRIRTLDDRQLAALVKLPS